MNNPFNKKNDPLVDAIRGVVSKSIETRAETIQELADDVQGGNRDRFSVVQELDQMKATSTETEMVLGEEAELDESGKDRADKAENKMFNRIKKKDVAKFVPPSGKKDDKYSAMAKKRGIKDEYSVSESFKPVKDTHDFVRISIKDEKNVGKILDWIMKNMGGNTDALVDTDGVSGGGVKDYSAGNIDIEGEDAGDIGVDVAKKFKREVKVVGESFSMNEGKDLGDDGTELKLYIENDANLYRQQIVPIVKNIQRRMKKGTYDHKLAPKLWMYLVDNGARLYVKEYGGRGDSVRQMFPKKTREAVAREFADEYRDELDAQGGVMFDHVEIIKGNEIREIQENSLYLWEAKGWTLLENPIDDPDYDGKTEGDKKGKKSKKEKIEIDPKIEEKLTPEAKKNIRRAAGKGGVKVRPLVKLAKSNPKNNEEVELDERNYALERKNYHSRPDQMENNRSRKRARYAMEKAGKVKRGDGMDVAHKDNDPTNNDLSNLAVQSQAQNRSEPRHRDAVSEATNWVKQGAAAFKKGIKAIPVNDPVVMKHIKKAGSKIGEGDSLKIMTDWTKGWHDANLKEAFIDEALSDADMRIIEIDGKFQPQQKKNGKYVNVGKPFDSKAKALAWRKGNKTRGIFEDVTLSVDMQGTRGQRGKHTVSARTQKEALYKVRRKEGLGKTDVYAQSVEEPEMAVEAKQEGSVETELVANPKTQVVKRIPSKEVKSWLKRGWVLAEETLDEASAAARARKDAKRHGAFGKKKVDSADVDSSSEEDNDSGDNIVVQLRKAVSVKKPMKFKDGKTVKIDPRLAIAAQTQFDNLKGPDRKEAWMKKAHASHDSLKKLVKEEIDAVLNGEDLEEGWKIIHPAENKPQKRKGLEGPFLSNDRHYYFYDPKEGKYYNPRSDIFLDHKAGMKLFQYDAMTVHEDMHFSVIDEGTWALPKTPKERAALKKLLSKPLNAKSATDKLYDIIGDDSLFDEIDDFASTEPNADVRPMVRTAMKRLGIKEEVEEAQIIYVEQRPAEYKSLAHTIRDINKKR
jgi:hypothetical protein